MAMPPKTPGTLEQLPKSADVYYSESLRSPIYAYEYIGDDDIGHPMYQKLFDGEVYGQPRSLLPYKDFVASVKRAARYCSSIGVDRWVSPTVVDNAKRTAIGLWVW